MRMRKSPRRIRFGGWNAHNASGKRLRRYVRKCLRKGHVAIVLTEVWRRHDELEKIADNLGLTMLSESPGNRDRDPIDDSGDMVVLLAPDFEIEDWEVIPLSTHWRVFSANRLHQPQRIIRVLGSVEGQRVELLGLHGPTGGNREASAEFLEVVAGLLTKTRADTLAVGVGDWNVRLSEALAWAREHGLTISGHGPDLAATNGWALSSRRRGKRTSDHYAMSHTAKRRKSKRKRKP